MDKKLLEKFSNNAVNIFEDYKNKYTNDIIVVSDQKMYVELAPNKYMIHLDFSMPINIVEITFIHELFHCFQKEEGFPNVTAKSCEYSNISNIISSTILDLDVNERLNKYGYEHDLNPLRKQIFECKNKLLFAKENSDMYKHIQGLNEYVYTCSIIAFCRMYFNNSIEIKEVLNITKDNFCNIYKDQNIIYNTINLYKYNTPRKVLKIFKKIIPELELGNYIKIV